MEGVTYSALAVDDEYAIIYRALKMHRRADELVFSQSRIGNIGRPSSSVQNRILLEIDSTGEGTPVASGQGQLPPPLNFGLSENCRNIFSGKFSSKSAKFEVRTPRFEEL